MEHCVVLDIRSVADYDTIFVTPYYGTKPDTDLFTQDNIATDGGALRYEGYFAPSAISSHNNIGS
jgi:hypothetical protein